MLEYSFYINIAEKESFKNLSLICIHPKSRELWKYSFPAKQA